MEELISEIIDYLPVSYSKSNEEEYIEFLLKAAQDNYESENWQFSYFAIHLVFMWYIYTLIWKIKHIDHERFQLAIKLHDYEKVIKLFNGADSPADYHKLPESQIMHFMRLIIEDEPKIREFKKSVSLRNELAHCNTLIKVDCQPVLEKGLQDIIMNMHELHDAFSPLLKNLFDSFLFESRDPEEREFVVLEDQVREVLVHRNYLSNKDLEEIMKLIEEPDNMINEIAKIIREDFLGDGSNV